MKKDNRESECSRCGELIADDQAATGNPPCHVLCPPPADTDQNGVDFGRNCLTPQVCQQQNLCLGTCKLF